MCRSAGWFGTKPDPRPLDVVTAAVAIAVGILALGGAYTGIVQKFDKLEVGQMTVATRLSKLEEGQSKLEEGQSTVASRLGKLEQGQNRDRAVSKPVRWPSRRTS